MKGILAISVFNLVQKYRTFGHVLTMIFCLLGNSASIKNKYFTLDFSRLFRLKIGDFCDFGRELLEAIKTYLR